MNEYGSKADILVVLQVACQCLGFFFFNYLLIKFLVIIPLLSLEKSLLENITY